MHQSIIKPFIIKFINQFIYQLRLNLFFQTILKYFYISKYIKIIFLYFLNFVFNIKMIKKNNKNKKKQHNWRGKHEHSANG
jgi:hypothetical protein